MKKILSLLSLTALILGAGLSTARAEVFVYGDTQERFTVTFPDTWMMVHNQQPDDRITIVAPGDGHFAQCRVRTRDDSRFLVYPPRLAGNVQRVAYSKDFWFDYVNEYDEPYVASVTDVAGLGRGFASYAEIEFDTVVGPRAHKRGIAFVSLYHDKVYIVDCSAEASVYEQWREPFLSVIKSVDFNKVIHELPTGNYRDFLADQPLQINGRRPVDVTFH